MTSLRPDNFPHRPRPRQRRQASQLRLKGQGGPQTTLTVDLLPVVRRHYYHRDQRGSWSIKAVLPTIVPDLGYDTLVEVKSGTDAQAGYMEAISEATSAERKQAIRAALLAYCARDTLAMKVVLERLLVNGGS